MVYRFGGSPMPAKRKRVQCCATLTATSRKSGKICALRGKRCDGKPRWVRRVRILLKDIALGSRGTWGTTGGNGPDEAEPEDRARRAGPEEWTAQSGPEDRTTCRTAGPDHTGQDRRTRPDGGPEDRTRPGRTGGPDQTRQDRTRRDQSRRTGPLGAEPADRTRWGRARPAGQTGQGWGTGQAVSEFKTTPSNAKRKQEGQ